MGLHFILCGEEHSERLLLIQQHQDDQGTTKVFFLLREWSGPQSWANLLLLQQHLYIWDI